MKAPDIPTMQRSNAATLRLVFWVIAVQAIFWAAALVIRPPTPDPIFEQHRIDNVLLRGADGALREAGGRPKYYLGEGRDAIFEAALILDRPDAGLVVFAPRYNRWATLQVNGNAIPISDAPAWRAGRLGAKWAVPPQLLKRGENIIAVEIRRECCRAYLWRLIAAPPGEIDVAIRQWRMQSLLPAFGLLALGLFGAVACLIVASNAAYRPIASAAAIAFTGMALGGLWQIDILTPSSETVYLAAGQMTLLATFAGMVALADRWFPGGPRFDRPLIILVPIFAAAIMAAPLLLESMPLLMRNLLEGAIVVLANLAILACIGRALKIDRHGWIPDVAVVLLVPAISVADLIDSIQINPLALNTAPLGVLGLALLLLLGIVRRGQMLSQRLEHANALLDAKIAAKQAELETTAELLRQRDAEAAVQNERNRIMRDMHDGMGGQLLSVLMLSRDQASPREAIADTAEQAIDDLRLLIDSLDSVGETLDIALGQFRERAETKLRAAGMRLAWSNQLGRQAITLPPGSILAAYRIMQEAINNAVRHSGGSEVSIVITLDGAGVVAIIISDDGKPDRATWNKGRGLANMATRAEAIGGALAIETGAAGTSVTLTIPVN